MRHELTSIFEQIYATDLVYRRDCWQLCGDAHCCNFARHKARFRLLARHGTQELPLLPGELDFLRAHGWDAQFGDYRRSTVRYPYGNGTIAFDSIVSNRGSCVCDHGTRTVICRLYPQLPVFDSTGALTGIAPLGIFEEIERIEGMEPACRLGVDDVGNADQVDLFNRMCRLLAASPVLLFHMIAYNAAKAHIASRLAERKAATGKSAFALFEAALLRGRLVDDATFKPQLAHLHAGFELRYGAAFTEGMTGIYGATSALGTPIAESVTSASRS